MRTATTWGRRGPSRVTDRKVEPDLWEQVADSVGLLVCTRHYQACIIGIAGCVEGHGPGPRVNSMGQRLLGWAALGGIF